MYQNAKPNEVVALLTTVATASTAASTVTSGWVSMASFFAIMAVIHTGTLGASATVDAKIEQATDSSGTGAKDVSGKAITQIVKATGDDKQAIINLRSGELDVANSFNYVRLSITVGTATSVIGGTVYGVNPRFGPASDYNATSVKQSV